MNKVGIVTRNLSQAHGVRGVGFYTRNLVAALTRAALQSDFQILEVGPGNFSGLDLVHYPYFDLFKPGLPFFKSLPAVVTVHDVIPLEFPDIYRPGLRGSLNFLWQKIALRSASVVVTDSYASVKGIKRYLQIPDAKIKLVYLAADPVYTRKKNPAELKIVRSKYHLPPEFVLYVGDINWNKNLPGLFRACQELKIPLVLAGKSALEIETLDSRHPELRHLENLKSYIVNQKSQFIRLGFVPDAELVSVYQLATVYCQPSFREGFGFPVLEALSCGTPVICSRASSLPEIAGLSAVYFDPYNQMDFTAKLKSVFFDKTLRSGMSAAGPAQALLFSWDRVAGEMLSVYRSVLNKSI